MKFLVGVVVGFAIGRNVQSSVTAKMAPEIKSKLADVVYSITFRLNHYADTLGETQENNR